MNCMKCGAVISDDQVFCDKCIEEMKKYPVKPGTPIQLPHHDSQPSAKQKRTRRKRKLPPEEQIRKLRSTVFWLGLTLVFVTLAFAAAAYLAIHLLNQRDASSALGFYDMIRKCLGLL